VKLPPADSAYLSPFAFEEINQTEKWTILK